MRKIVNIWLVFTVFFIVVPSVFANIEAAFFQFGPTSATASAGKTVSIKVNINAGTDLLLSTDAYILYDSTILQAQSVTAGTFFPPSISSFNSDTSTAGKVYIGDLLNDTSNPASGTGTLATITFQALNNGQATLSIDCNNSKLVANDASSSNVMQCAQNGTSVITVGTGSSGYMTTPGPTPSILPKSGIFDNVVRLAVPGVILLFLGAAVRLFL